jgi:hypothetical protein
MSLASRLLSLLKQMEQVITSSPEAEEPMRRPTRAVVDYYAITPKGSRTRFPNIGIGLNQMQGNPRSETAVLAYLRKKHPGCDIQINDIDFE